jgi:hypothetical protein
MNLLPLRALEPPGGLVGQASQPGHTALHHCLHHLARPLQPPLIVIRQPACVGQMAQVGPGQMLRPAIPLEPASLVRLGNLPVGHLQFLFMFLASPPPLLLDHGSVAGILLRMVRPTERHRGRDLDGKIPPKLAPGKEALDMDGMLITWVLLGVVPVMLLITMFLDPILVSAEESTCLFVALEGRQWPAQLHNRWSIWGGEGNLTGRSKLVGYILLGQLPLIG